MDLGLDIDGVLYPFDRALARHVERVRGLPPGTLPAARTWDFFRAQWGMTREEYLAVYADGVRSGSLFTAEAPYPGAVDAVLALEDAGHRIHYVTARGTTPEDRDLLWWDTADWLLGWGFPLDSLTVTADKPAACLRLGVRHHLDDAPHQYDALEAAGLTPWLLDRPWNTTHPGRRTLTLGAWAPSD